MKLSSLLLFAVLIFTGCSKKDLVPPPTASFTYSSVGDGGVFFQLTSSNATEYSWDFGNNVSSSDRNPTIQYSRNGVYDVKVTVKGEGGTSDFTAPVTVRSVKGTVMFWMQVMKGKEIGVYVDGVYRGKIIGYYSSGAPSCGAQYCVTVSGLSEGEHVFTAQELDTLFPSKWSNTFSVVGGDCSKRQLTY